MAGEISHLRFSQSMRSRMLCKSTKGQHLKQACCPHEPKLAAVCLCRFANADAKVIFRCSAKQHACDTKTCEGPVCPQQIAHKIVNSVNVWFQAGACHVMNKGIRRRRLVYNKTYDLTPQEKCHYEGRKVLLSWIARNFHVILQLNNLSNFRNLHLPSVAI